MALASAGDGLADSWELPGARLTDSVRFSSESAAAAAAAHASVQMPSTFPAMAPLPVWGPVQQPKWEPLAGGSGFSAPQVPSASPTFGVFGPSFAPPATMPALAPPMPISTPSAAAPLPVSPRLLGPRGGGDGRAAVPVLSPRRLCQQPEASPRWAPTHPAAAAALGIAPGAGEAWRPLVSSDEVQNLKSEIDELLRTHARTPASNVEEPPSGHVAQSHYWQGSTDPGWEAERRTLELRIEALTERLRAGRQRQHAGSQGLLGPSATTHADLERERSALAQRLHDDEVACAEATRRAQGAEVKLARAFGDLEELHRLSRPKPLSPSAGAEQPQASTTRRLAEVRAALKELQWQMQTCDTHLAGGREALDRWRGQRETKVQEHGSLRFQLSHLGEQLQATTESLQGAHRTFEGLRSGRGRDESEWSVEGRRWADHVRSLQDDLERLRAKQKVAETTAHSSRRELLDRQGFLASARSSGSTAAEQLRRRTDEQVAAASAAGQRVAAVEAEHMEASRRVEFAQTKLKEEQAYFVDRLRGLREENHVLASERQRAFDDTEHARQEMAELLAQAEGLAASVRAERARGVELTHDILAAREVASRSRSPSAKRSDGPSGARQRSCSPLRRQLAGRPQLERRRRQEPRPEQLQWDLDGTPATASASRGAPPGGQKLGSSEHRDELRAEVHGLQTWKHDAVGSVQRMMEGLQAARAGYTKQMQYGAELEAAIRRLGAEAWAATTADGGGGGYSGGSGRGEVRSGSCPDLRTAYTSAATEPVSGKLAEAAPWWMEEPRAWPEASSFRGVPAAAAPPAMGAAEAPRLRAAGRVVGVRAGVGNSGRAPSPGAGQRPRRASSVAAVVEGGAAGRRRCAVSPPPFGSYAGSRLLRW
mmetsp:Transcript_250/g.1056  ORF Transcript_250/g.1056 Transcript_250/m.1056 type:complete len:883 (-) Transcript_250:75-2723(-)